MWLQQSAPENVITPNTLMAIKFMAASCGPVVIVLLARLLAGCHKPQPAAIQPPFTAGYNYLYGTDTIQQTLDYYLPTVRSRAETPVVVMLHGGAWVQGNKADFNVIGLDTLFTSYGMAVVNMNYRVDKYYPYPAPLEDIATVLKLITAKADEWQINPNKICLLGRSAGGQLAMLYAYGLDTFHRIKAVIENCGPTDFTDTSVVNYPLGQNVSVWLGPYASNAARWRYASPLSHMRGAVPTVILMGLADPLVLPIQSFMLEDSLAARNIPCMFVGWPGSAHGWNLTLWPLCKDQTVQWVRNFL